LISYFKRKQYVNKQQNDSIIIDFNKQKKKIQLHRLGSPSWLTIRINVTATDCVSKKREKEKRN